MRLRHIHAKPGEHVVVHRKHRNYTPSLYQSPNYYISSGNYANGSVGGGSSCDSGGCLSILGMVAFVFVIIVFWKEILCVLLGIGVLFLIGWLIWKFHLELVRGIVFVIRAVWKGIKAVSAFIWRLMVKGYHAIARGKSCTQTAWSNGSPVSSGNQAPANKPDNYGKIIQSRF